MESKELVIVLLTRGGLALIGTVLGALITQVFAVRIGRETRREERRMAVKTFQRDTLVAVQDDLLDAMNLFEKARGLRNGPKDEFAAARREFESVARRVQMHATRVRDEQLRSAVNTWIGSERGWFDDIETVGMVTASTIRKAALSVHQIHDRAGELIRTLDAIDEPESPVARMRGLAGSVETPDDVRR